MLVSIFTLIRRRIDIRIVPIFVLWLVVLVVLAVLGFFGFVSTEYMSV